MSTYTETRTLDLLKHKGKAGGVPPITLRRGEAGADITINVTNNGEAFNLTGYTAKFCAVNAKGEKVKRAASVTNAASGAAKYTVTSDLTAWAGPVLVGYLELTKTGELATTDTLPFIILDNADITDEEAAEYQSSIDAMLNAAQEAAVAAAQTAFESAYADAEAARDALYAEAESDRDDAYAAAEAGRNANTSSAPFSVRDGKLCVTYYTGTI